MRLLQHGESVETAIRPMRSIGAGVFELKDSDEKAWYRVIYLARIDGRIHVLDCFTKNTRKTERHIIQRAKARLAQVLQNIREERRDGKRKGSR